MSEARDRMRFWKSALIVASACEASALAVWLLPASIHIVRWPASGPVRLALLAPAWQLGALLAVGLLVAAGVVVWGSPSRVRRVGALRRTSGGARLSGAETDSLEQIARTVAPFGLLWLWAVPYLPWLPDRLPLLLVLSGPLRWGLLAVALILVLLATTNLLSHLSAIGRLGRRGVFGISLAVYLGIGLYTAREVGVGGDEPHYLIISESLLKDGDLKIENNHQQGDYRSFFGGNLRPDFFERGKDGEIYSIHAPGLPVLTLPAYAAAGRSGVVAFMALLAALAALAVFDLSDAIAGRRAAIAAWAAACFTVPFLPHAWMIFPEIPGALIVAWAALWIWQSTDRSSAVWLVRGLVLGALPWLHTKFAVFLAIFAVALAVRLVRQPARITAFLVPVVASTALWLYSFYAIYGVFDWEAPYGAYIPTYVLTKYIPHGLVGILFDQKFGLLFYSPIYLSAVAGAWMMLRRRDTRYLAGVLVAVVGVFVGSTARLYMFWGGSSAPARFLVPILPCLAPMVALSVREVRGTLPRAFVWLGLAFSLAIAAVGIVHPERFVLFSDPHGRARILELIQGASPLAMVVPTFTEPEWASQLPALGAWFGAAAVALGVAAMISRRASSSGCGVAGTFCVTFLVAGAVVSARPGAEVREATAQRGALDVLWRFDGQRFRTFDYETGGRVASDRLRELTTIVLPVPRPPLGSGGYVSAPLTLPAGAYEASISLGGARPREGEVLVTAAPQIVLGRLAGVLDESPVIAFDLPFTVRRLTLRVPDAALASAITRIEIVPKAVLSPGDREGAAIRVVESIPGRVAAYVAYTDEEAYPEGGIFWSRGTARTLVLVAPMGASRMKLTLSTGPMTGTVALSVDGRPMSVDMVAGQENTVSFDLQPGARVVPLTVESTVMFRPAVVNPNSSTDMRGLGCQVRISLE